VQINVGITAAARVQVNITTFDMSFYPLVESSQWQLVRTKNERNSVLYSCCPNPFVDVRFNLLLRRRPTFASHLFVAPSVVLCLITPSVFVLPPASYEKLTLGKLTSHARRRGRGCVGCVRPPKVKCKMKSKV